MKDDINLYKFWMSVSPLNEIRDHIQTEPYNESSSILFELLLHYFEEVEEYERCQVLKEEIDFRDRLHNDLYGFREIE